MNRKKTAAYYYIYITFNLINDRFYVGQRGCNCLPDEDVDYLGSGVVFKRAIKKYGKDSFHKEIVEVVSIEDLDEKEIFYVKYFDAKNQELGGYNLTDGGSGVRGLIPSSETIEKFRLSHIKYTYVLRTPSNEAITIDNLTLFAKNNNLSFGNLWQTLRGKQHNGRNIYQEKGFTILLRKDKDVKITDEEINIKLQQFNSINRCRNKWGIESIERSRKSKVKFNYVIQLPNGKLFTTNTLAGFCKANNLQDGKLSDTLNGVAPNGRKVSQHKGFKLLSKESINKQIQEN